MAVKGKWAQGIKPRNFHWIIKDRLAVCERPGGYGSSHRKVRRQEEIIWIREQQFTSVISLIPANHNLHNYDELSVSWQHWPFGPGDEPATYLAEVGPKLHAQLSTGARLLLHGDEVNDRVCGLVGGYLRWSGLVTDGPECIEVVERITQRQLGPVGRDLIAVAGQLPPPDVAG